MSALATFAALREAARTAPPEVALVLGSGSGTVAARCRAVASVAFAEIPGFAATSVVGHRGTLTLGDWAGRRVLLFEGRLHRYEGHSWDMVISPVRVAFRLGASILLLTNAAGGIDPALGPGALMAIRDHIEWTRPNPWQHPGPGGLGGFRPSPYTARLLGLMVEAGRETGTRLREGLYAALTGPCYETPAEIRALRAWGASAVGMSTAREAQAAFELGLECAALSLITNQAAGLGTGPINHEEVLTCAAAQAEQLGTLLDCFLRRLPAAV